PDFVFVPLRAAAGAGISFAHLRSWPGGTEGAAGPADAAGDGEFDRIHPRLQRGFYRAGRGGDRGWPGSGSLQTHAGPDRGRAHHSVWAASDGYFQDQGPLYRRAPARREGQQHSDWSFRYWFRLCLRLDSVSWADSVGD